MFTYNNKQVKAINFNGKSVKVLKYNGIVVWQSSSGYKVNWNQYIENYPSSISYYNGAYNATITLPERGVLNVKSKNGAGVGWAMRKNISTDILGHILYYRIRVRLNSDTYSTDIFRQCMYDEGIGNASNLYTDENCLNEYADYTILLKQKAGYQNYNQIRFYTPTNSMATADYKECLCLDLTKMFGSGNEPYTVEELEEWLEENKDNIDLYAYDQGTEREVTKPKWLTVPNEYTQLEYLEGDGTAFISTDLQFSFPVYSVGKMQYFGNPVTSGNNSVFSPVGSTGTGGYIGYDSAFCWGLAGGDNLTIPANEVLEFQYNKATASGTATLIDQNGNKVTRSGASTNINPLCLCKINATSTTTKKLRTYYVNVYDNTKACRLVPVKRNSDNELGMYDLVSGKFYTNAGGGSFIGGNPI